MPPLLSRLTLVLVTLALPLAFSRTREAGLRGAPVGTVTEVAPGVFFSQTPTEPKFLGANSGFVVVGSQVVVVDPSFPGAARTLVDEVKKRTDKPVRLFFDTHYHPDHVFGAGIHADGGATGIAHADCIADERTKTVASFTQQQASSDPAERAVVEGTHYVPAAIGFEKKLVVEDGGRRIEFLHFGAAHTRGDAVAWLPAERVLYTGDVCVNGAFNYMGDGDSASWIAVLDALIALQPKVVCPGHGAAAGPELLAKQRRWIADLRTAVAEGLRAGKDAEAIRAGLDWKWYEEWTGVKAATRSENVGRIFAELAGLVPPPELMGDLGLQPGPSPTRETPGWTKPTKVVVPAFGDDLLAQLRRVAPGVTLVPASDARAAVAVCADADAVIGNCSAQILETGARLRWVQVGSAGVEAYVGLPKVQSRQVVLTNAQRLYGPEIADHALALLLALTRGLRGTIPNQLAGAKWETPADYADRTVELTDKRVLVVGLGGIGLEIARRVQAFGATVVATQGHPVAPPPFVQRIAPPEEMLELAATADVVFICVPLTPQTENMCDAEFFAALKPGARFVNVARGRLVDTAALIGALKSGRLGGAGLDVTDPEPLPPDHELWKLDHVVITPHDAAASDLARRRQFLLFRENLRRFTEGLPLLSVVDPANGY